MKRIMFVILALCFVTWTVAPVIVHARDGADRDRPGGTVSEKSDRTDKPSHDTPAEKDKPDHDPGQADKPTPDHSPADKPGHDPAPTDKEKCDKVGLGLDAAGLALGIGGAVSGPVGGIAAGLGAVGLSRDLGKCGVNSMSHEKTAEERMETNFGAFKHTATKRTHTYRITPTF